MTTPSPTNAPATVAEYLNRGRMYYMNGEIEKAIADLSQTIWYSPDDAKAYICRSYVYFYNGEHTRAADDVYRVRRIDQKFDPSEYLNMKGLPYAVG